MTLPDTPRIAPIDAPYPAQAAELFARVTPPGQETLRLFRTMARSPRILQRMFAGGLIDKGAIGLRDRELIILRTCARCGSEYEWGVHVALFAAQAGLDEEQVAATCGTAPQNRLSERDMLPVRLADELHDGATISDALWESLSASFSEEQLLELIALAGYYHTISFITNAARVEREAWAPRFAA